MKLLGVEVKERDGAINLTDLWRASGGERRFTPSIYLSREGTKLFISECMNMQNTKTCYQTKPIAYDVKTAYVSEHVAIHYAMWVSPKFAFEVIDFFVRYRTQQYKSIRHIVPQPGEMRKRFWKVMQDGGLVVKDGCGYRATTYAVENGLARTMDCVNENGEYYTTVEFSDEGIKLWM